MILVTTATAIEGYQIVAYKGTAQDVTLQELEHYAESLGANATLNSCYDDTLDVDTLFHGAAVIIKPIPVLPHHLCGGALVFVLNRPSEGNR